MKSCQNAIVTVLAILVVFVLWNASSPIENHTTNPPLSTSTPHPTWTPIPNESTSSISPTQASERTLSTPTRVLVSVIAKLTVKNTGTEYVNLRKGPSIQHEITGRTFPGAQFAALGRDSTGSWYQVEYMDTSHWVYAELVDVVNAHVVPIVEHAVVPHTPIPTPLPTIKAKSTPTPTRAIDSRYIPISPSYKTLYRNIDHYFRQRVSYIGIVIQALPGDFNGNIYDDYQLVVLIETSDLPTEVFLMRYDDADYRLLKGDTIQFIAEVRELATYQTVLYGPLTVPYMIVLELQLLE